MRYRKEIDGLRALAVLPVIFFHAGFEIFSGGFVGVDVFFVISGYLITTIILSELEQGSLSIAGFYERRARRILPALFVVMLVCMPLGWFLLLPSDMKDFSKSLIAVSVFASNILFWQESNYFDATAELKPLLHTWSLAVEEQYYVIFPLFLILTWKLGKRWIVALLSVVGIFSLGLAQTGSTDEPAAAFYLLPTRGWELLIGAFIAFYQASDKKFEASQRVREFGGFVGLALLLYATFTFDAQTPYPSLYTLVPTVGTALIILHASQSTLVGKFLGIKMLVGIGLISYSTYLWHQPIFAFARHFSINEPSEIMFAGLTLSSIALAVLSWKFVEIPFRNHCVIKNSTFLLFSIAGTAAFIGAGLVGVGSDGKLRSLDNSTRYNELLHRLRPNYGLHETCEKKVVDAKNCRTADDPEIMLWGDSYAMHLARGFLASNSKVKLIQATVSECPSLLGLAHPTAGHGAKNCIDSNEYAISLLEKYKSIKYVVLASPSFLLGNTKVIVKDGGLKSVDLKEIEDKLVDTLERIKQLGAEPVIFSPTPLADEDLGQCLLKAEVQAAKKDVCNFAADKAILKQEAVLEVLRRINKMYRVIWLGDGICKDGFCMASFGNVYIYRDAGHLSYEGSAWLGREMDFYGSVIK